MNLFEANKNNVSKNEMENYLNNSLSHEEKHTLEKAMQNDPFLEDAMDGFEKFPNEINNIPKLKKSYKKPYLITFLSLFLIGIISILIINNQNTSREFTPITSNINKTKINKKKVIVNDVKEVEETNLNENNIPQNSVKNETSIIDEKEKTIPFVRETVNLETYKSTPEIYSQKLNYNITKTKIKTIAYYDFLAVDYSVIYVNEIPFEEIEIGTPASQSNPETYNLNDHQKLSKTKKYSYTEYLKKSLKLLSEKKYTNAISNFNTILKHYPNDVNAQFYIGFSYFNMSKHEKSSLFFDKAMNNSFDFFYEDAQWYKALSLEGYGKLKEAKKLYKEIIKKEGFYANQAYEKL